MEKEKYSLKDRLENYWYFYKWHTILGAIVLIGIIIAIVQMTGKASPDAALMYVGPSMVTPSDKDSIDSESYKYINDYNNDKKITLYFLDIMISVLDEGDSEKSPIAWEINNQAYQRFDAEVSVGDSMIYVLEESFYNRLVENGLLSKLSDVLDNDMIPAETYGEYGVRLSELPFFEKSGYSSMPKDSILCIRRSPTTDQFKYGRTHEYWQSNVVLFKAMFGTD